MNTLAYRTRQKDAVLSCLRGLEGRHATAAEVAAALREAGQSVGLSTVYRQLEQLVNEGAVKKFLTGDGSACFQLPLTASLKSLSTKLCSSRAQLRST